MFYFLNTGLIALIVASTEGTLRSSLKAVITLNNLQTVAHPVKRISQHANKYHI